MESDVIRAFAITNIYRLIMDTPDVVRRRGRIGQRTKNTHTRGAALGHKPSPKARLRSFGRNYKEYNIIDTDIVVYRRDV